MVQGLSASSTSARAQAPLPSTHRSHQAAAASTVQPQHFPTGASCSTHVPDCFGINSAKAHTTELGGRQLPAPGRGDLAGGWTGCTASPQDRRQWLRMLLLSKGSLALGSLEERGSQCSSSVASKCHLCHQREQGSALVLGCK